MYRGWAGVSVREDYVCVLGRYIVWGGTGLVFCRVWGEFLVGYVLYAGCSSGVWGLVLILGVFW